MVFSAPPPSLAREKIPPPVLDIVSRLKAAGFKAYLVGGGVRDFLLGGTPKDFDVATSALPRDVQRLFRKVIPTGIQHGTVTVLLRGTAVEVTTFRKESDYHDGRRPSAVEFHDDVTEDLSRRDFTINAIAFDPLALELVDPFGGQADLAARLIRCVGDAVARFSEDGLRPLRAVRFAAVLGFTLDPSTAAAIPGVLAVFRKVAQERVCQELTKLLLSDRPGTGVRLLARTGLLPVFLPEALESGEECLGRKEAALDASAPILEVRLALLLAGTQPETALRRLTFPAKVIEKVVLLLSHPLPASSEGWTDPQARRFLSAIGPANAADVLELARAERGEAAAHTFGERLHAILAQKPPLYTRELALDGNAIMATLGVGPGRLVGEATRFLLEQVLDSPGKNQPAELVALLRSWAASQGL